MKTAGLVLDFYDDVQGTVLKELYPTADELPDLIKEAHILRPEEHDVLRDEAYALVAVNDGKMLRKFACIDAGNTFLSMMYFDKLAHLLPLEAREIAGEKILEKAIEFGLIEKEAGAADFVVKHQKKIGLGLGAAAAAGLAGPSIVKDVKKAKAKTAAAKGANRTRDPMRQPYVSDDADWAQRTNLLSVQGQDGGRVTDAVANMKTAGVIDLSNHQPVVEETRTITKTAMADGRYPLDTYSDVEQARAYFFNQWPQMDPADRREFATKTAARCEELGAKLSCDVMERYAAQGYAEDVEAHLASRRSYAPEYSEMYDELQGQQVELAPEVFAEVLGEIDKVAGLNWLYDGDIADPFYATFGPSHEPQVFKTASAEVTDEELLELAASNGLHGVFDFAEQFNKDPVAIFQSLPDDSKELIASMAKTASIAGHAAEVAGLGILARPSLRKMQGKQQSEKSTHRHEVAGLGVLAAPSAIELGKKGLSALKKVKKAGVEEGASDTEGPATEIPIESGSPSLSKEAAGFDRAKGLATAASAAVKTPKKALTMDMIAAAKKRMAAGGSGAIK